MKKGISPLIATVLIIGFTIALAAVILTWGQTFTEKLTEKTETVSEEGTVCLQDVDIDIKSVCYDTESKKVLVQVENEKENPISGLVFRIIYNDKSADTYADSDETNVDGETPLAAFQLELYKVTYDNTKPLADNGALGEIEILPKTKLASGKEITCEKKFASEIIYSEC